MKISKQVFLGMMFLLVSLACVITVPVPGADFPTATIVASPTSSFTPSHTPEPSVTPFPTPTRRATSEAFSTILAEATVALPPTITPAVFVEPVQGQDGSNPTPTRSGPKVIWTSTPASLKCETELLKPAWGEDFKPRTDFMAIWRVYNVGTAPWGSGEFIFEYVSGDKLQSRDYYAPLLSFTVYVKDRVKFDIRLKSPKEPGRYTAVWGMRKTNKKEPFCTFSLSIDVVK